MEKEVLPYRRHSGLILLSSYSILLSSTAIAVRDNFFGVGPRVVINNVDCTGQERNLTDCNFDTNTFFCFTDASIICRRKLR